MTHQGETDGFCKRKLCASCGVRAKDSFLQSSESAQSAFLCASIDIKNDVRITKSLQNRPVVQPLIIRRKVPVSVLHGRSQEGQCLKPLFLLALRAIAAICQAHGKPTKAEFKRRTGAHQQVLLDFECLQIVIQGVTIDQLDDLWLIAIPPPVQTTQQQPLLMTQFLS